ncbi:MAG TPA: 2TM domain-containing protein [Saprospiraceae bacterium]|nr:2TM domain-containing protein [Saprospiraceae bacterium]
MEDWRYKIAKKRVKKVKGFFSHFTTWLVFCAFFIFLNAASGGGSFWAIWPIMGWGLGVAFHAIGVFGIPGLGKDWEERMIEKEMERVEQTELQKRVGTSNRLPPRTGDAEDGLELKEVRKAWKDSDLV